MAQDSPAAPTASAAQLQDQQDFPGFRRQNGQEADGCHEHKGDLRRQAPAEQGLQQLPRVRSPTDKESQGQHPCRSQALDGSVQDSFPVDEKALRQAPQDRHVRPNQDQDRRPWGLGIKQGLAEHGTPQTQQQQDGQDIPLGPGRASHQMQSQGPRKQVKQGFRIVDGKGPHRIRQQYEQLRFPRHVPDPGGRIIPFPQLPHGHNSAPP